MGLSEMPQGELKPVTGPVQIVSFLSIAKPEMTFGRRAKGGTGSQAKPEILHQPLRQFQAVSLAINAE